MNDPVTVHHQMKSHSDFLRAQPAVARFPITPAVIIHIFLNRLFLIWGAGEEIGRFSSLQRPQSWGRFCL